MQVTLNTPPDGGLPTFSSKGVRIMKNKELELWLSIGVINAVVLYTSSLILPSAVVIGNEFIEKWMATILTAFLLTVLLVLTKPVLKTVGLKVKGDLPINITYGVVNIVGLWVLARLAKYIGFGVSSFWVAIILGALLTIIQFLIWKTVVGKAGRK